MRWRKLPVTVVLLFAAALAYGQNEGDGGNPYQSARCRHSGPPRHGTWPAAQGPGGGMIANDPAGTRGVYSPSKLDSLADRDAWIYTGRAPNVYKLLGLTDEQHQAVEQLVKEARDTFQTCRQTRDPNVLRDQQKMADELKATYYTRILDLLTDEQRGLLEKIMALLAERQEKMNAVYQEMNARVQKLREEYDGKLVEFMTPEQVAQLDEILKPLQPRIPPVTPEKPTGAAAEETLF